MVFLVTESTFLHIRAKNLCELTLAYQFIVTFLHPNLYFLIPPMSSHANFSLIPSPYQAHSLLLSLWETHFPVWSFGRGLFVQCLRNCSYVGSSGMAFRSLPGLSDFPYSIPVKSSSKVLVTLVKFISRHIFFARLWIPIYFLDTEFDTWYSRMPDEWRMNK